MMTTVRVSVEEQYYSFIRSDILPLLPERANRVLEIGCGEGATLKWLKGNNMAAYSVGVELNPAAASVACEGLDEVYCCDIETDSPAFEPSSFDLVLCLDVLEHLRNPWATMAMLYTLLKPDGSIIISVPNVQHYSVVFPLMFKGQWRYEDSGLLDRTHLRFFTHQTARELLSDSGFSISGESFSFVENWHSGFLSKMRALFIPESLRRYQFILRGNKS